MLTALRGYCSYTGAAFEFASHEPFLALSTEFRKALGSQESTATLVFRTVVTALTESLTASYYPFNQMQDSLTED